MLMEDAVVFGDDVSLAVHIRCDKFSEKEDDKRTIGINFSVFCMLLGNIRAKSRVDLVRSVLKSILVDLKNITSNSYKEFFESAQRCAGDSREIADHLIEYRSGLPGFKGLLGSGHFAPTELGEKFRIKWDCECMDYSEYWMFVTPGDAGLRVDLIHKSGDTERSLSGFLALECIASAIREAVLWLENLD